MLGTSTTKLSSESKQNKSAHSQSAPELREHKRLQFQLEDGRPQAPTSPRWGHRKDLKMLPSAQTRNSIASCAVRARCGGVEVWWRWKRSESDRNSSWQTGAQAQPSLSSRPCPYPGAPWGRHSRGNCSIRVRFSLSHLPAHRTCDRHSTLHAMPTGGTLRRCEGLASGATSCNTSPMHMRQAKRRHMQHQSHAPSQTPCAL
jgi:hypothetical protein